MADARDGVPSQALCLPLFVDTNLDTHLALNVSPEDTVADVKSKVCFEHMKCFPKFGGVSVQSIKVRRRTIYYHMADTMLVRTAFDGFKGTWFLHVDVKPFDRDGALAINDENVERGSIRSPPAVAMNVDLNMQINDQSLSGGLLVPSLGGLNQSPRPLVVPSEKNVLPISDLYYETPKSSSETVNVSHLLENSAKDHGNGLDVNLESQKPLLQNSGVLKLTTEIQQLRKDACDKDLMNLNDLVNDAPAHTTFDGKEKSKKMGTDLEDDSLIKTASKKERHKEEGENREVDSWKSCEKFVLEAVEAIKFKNRSSCGDHAGGSTGLTDDVCEQTVKDEIVLPQDVPLEKKKRKKKKRKESDECQNEIDVSANEPNILALGTELYQKKNESGTALGEKAPSFEELNPTQDSNLGSNSAVKLLNEAVECSSNENHLEMDLGVSAKEKNLGLHEKRRKVKKGNLSVSDLVKTEVIQPVAKEMSGHDTEETKCGPECVSEELNKDVISKEAPEHDDRVLSKSQLADDIIPRSRRKKVHNVGSPRKFVVPRNFLQSDCPINRRKRSSKAKESSKEDQHEVHSEELMITKVGHTTKEKQRKAQHVNIANHNLSELPNKPSGKRKNKLKPHHSLENCELLLNGWKEIPNFPCIDISPCLQTSGSPHDPLTDIHQQDDSTGNEMKKLKQDVEEKGTIDCFGSNSLSLQQNVSDPNDDAMTLVNANPAAADDSTEEDICFNDKRYRVAKRKISSRSRAKRILTPHEQGALPSIEDGVFGHFTGNISEDEIERHDKKNVSENIIDSSNPDGSDEDLGQTEVILGPKTLKGASSHGESPSPSCPLRKKETMDDIFSLKTLKASDKRVQLGVLLRGSQTYRKAKMTAQSQTDDTEVSHLDVLKTQPESP